MSAVFTGWDDWAEPGGDRLCDACAWAYTETDLRQSPFRVAADGLYRLTRAQLLHLLTTAVPSDTAVTVPLRPGRKHLLPMARWGHVQLDDAALAWSTADADRLHTVIRLRQAGFGPRALEEPAPPYHLLLPLPTADWSSVLGDWAQLAPWRRARPWLALACYVTACLTPAGHRPPPGQVMPCRVPPRATASRQVTGA